LRRFGRFVSKVVKKDDRRRRPAVNLAPCSCAAAVMYKSTLPCCAHSKTRHCHTDASAEANQAFGVCFPNIPKLKFFGKGAWGENLCFNKGFPPKPSFAKARHKKSEREAQIKKCDNAKKTKRKQNTKANKKKANKNSAFLEVGRGCGGRAKLLFP